MKNNRLSKLKEVDVNTKNVIVSIFNSFFVKGGGIIVGFFTTPAYMSYFNDNSTLGVWFAMLSIFNWIINLDMGIGNGLRNKVVRTMVEKNNIETKKYISSAYFFLFFIAIIISGITIVLTPLLNWNNFFNISVEILPSSILENAVIIVLISIIIQFVLRLITSILFAMQKSFIPNLLTLSTNLFLLFFVLVCNWTGNNNNIILLAIAYLLASNFPLLIANLGVFLTVCKDVKPNIKYYDKNYATDILKVGGGFLLLQIESLIINSSSIFIITTFLGSAKVVEYNIYYKIFFTISSIFSLITIPIWSAVTKAVVENKIIWIRRTVRRLQGVAILFCIGQLILFPIMQTLVDIWLGNESIIINPNIMWFFVFEATITIWSGVNASISSGLNEIKLQTILMTVGAILMLPLSYIFISYFPIYTSVVAAHGLSLLPYCVGQTIWIENFLKKSSIDTEMKNLNSQAL